MKKLKKLLLITIILLVSLTSCNYVSDISKINDKHDNLEKNETEVITFIDPVFEKILREAWNKHDVPITKKDIESIKTLCLDKVSGFPYYTLAFSELSYTNEQEIRYAQDVVDYLGEENVYSASYNYHDMDIAYDCLPPIYSLEDISLFNNLETLCFKKTTQNEDSLSDTAVAFPCLDEIKWQYLRQLKRLEINGSFEWVYSQEYEGKETKYAFIGDPPINITKIVKSSNIEKIVLNSVTLYNVQDLSMLENLKYLKLKSIRYNGDVYSCDMNLSDVNHDKIIIEGAYGISGNIEISFIEHDNT